MQGMKTWYVISRPQVKTGTQAKDAWALGSKMLNCWGMVVQHHHTQAEEALTENYTVCCLVHSVHMPKRP